MIVCSHRYRKHTLVIVSHDRDFLNAVPTDIIRMANKKLERFKGNYDAYEKQLAEQIKAQVRDIALYSA